MRLFESDWYHKREVITLALGVAIIAAIFVPYPDISAVQVKLTHRNIGDDSKGLDLDIVAQDPAAIKFPNGLRTETIPFGEIRVILDPGTSNEKTATFDFKGNLVSDNSGGIITGLIFNGVTHHHKPGTFGYGYFYGYGYGYFNGYGFGKGTIGDGSTVDGLSSQPYGQDTIASYQVKLDPTLLPTGNHIIRVDVIPDHVSGKFFSSGDVSFHGKQATKTEEVSGKGHLGKGASFEFDVSSKDNTKLTGNFNYNDKKAHIGLGNTKITSLSVDSTMTHAVFTGEANANGGIHDDGKKNHAKFRFSVSVTDPDKTGNHDTLSITITDRTGATIYQNSGTVQGQIEIKTGTSNNENSDKGDNEKTDTGDNHGTSDNSDNQKSDTNDNQKSDTNDNKKTDANGKQNSDDNKNHSSSGNTVAAVTVTPAPAGSFNDPTNGGSITLCPAGTFQPHTGQSSCVQADIGNFVNAPGSTAETPCPVGTFSANKGSISCTLAPAGSYVRTTGATKTISCAPGTYADVSGLAQCKIADLGFFVSSSGATQQTQCPTGTTSVAESTSCRTIDNMPPTLEVPSDITQVSAVPVVISYSVSASDSLDPYPTVTCNPSSGSTFPVGKTTVSCTATDASGNTAHASFHVIIQAPPHVSAQSTMHSKQH